MNPYPYSFDNKRYQTFNYYLKQKYQKKVVKVILDAHFTCPNRDGSKGMGGCSYCSARGSGDFAGERGLPLEEQIYGITVSIRNLFDNGMGYSMSTPHYNDPYGYFILGTASCAGCTRATGLCLNILGIPYEHVNENQYSHQWCRINVNGTYWISDAYGLYCGPEPAPYAHPWF